MILENRMKGFALIVYYMGYMLTFDYRILPNVKQILYRKSEILVRIHSINLPSSIYLK